MFGYDGELRDGEPAPVSPWLKQGPEARYVEMFSVLRNHAPDSNFNTPTRQQHASVQMGAIC